MIVCWPIRRVVAAIVRPRRIFRPRLRHVAPLLGKAALATTGIACAALPITALLLEPEAMAEAPYYGGPVPILAGEAPLVLPAAAPVRVPEPGTLLLFAAGVGALAVVRRGGTR